jgi:hypothetical protein
VYSSIRADPNGALVALAVQDLRHGDHGRERAENPERKRVPYHPEVNAAEAVVIMPI